MVGLGSRAQSQEVFAKRTGWVRPGVVPEIDDSTPPRSRTPTAQAVALPSAPLHYTLDGVPDRARRTHRVAFFERVGVRYDMERLPDAPLEVDVTRGGLRRRPAHSLLGDVGPNRREAPRNVLNCT
jgi:hypothetical protein